MRKILTGAVTNAKARVLDAHLQTLKRQQVPEDAELDFFYIVDPTAPAETGQTLDEHDVTRVFGADKPEGAEYAVSDTTHHWTLPTFGWLAKEKQRILDRAREGGYSHVWLVDSDLLCAPDTLSSLLAAEKPIVSGVFWTRWQPDSPPLPQVWQRHPYEFEGRGIEAHEFLRSLATRQLIRVGGLGACTLIDTEALDGVAYWPLLEGLPTGGMWQGEDRHFCVRAEQSHIPLHADAWPDIWHCYRPSQEEQIDDRLEALSSVEDRPPTVGDLISAVLEPVEEPGLLDYKHHLRGRLGTLDILPDIEYALQQMHPGEDRFVRVRFPLWYPIAPYRGRELAVRIRLLGVKPFSLAPTLDETAYARQGSMVWEEFYE